MSHLAELHQDIRRALEVADVQRSRRLCDSILRARPDNLETLLLLAEVDLETGLHERAVHGFQRVLNGDPEAFLAFAGMAIAYEAMRDPGAAIHYYSRALDLNPANAPIRQERDRLCVSAYPERPLPPPLNECATARAFLEAGFYARSIEAHRTALKLEPGRVETRLGLAESLWMLGGTKEPQDVCQEILSEAPRSVKAQAIVACVTAETDDLDRGRDLLDDVHAQDPDGRIAGYIVGQTPLAEWAAVDVDLPETGEGADDESYDQFDLPPWSLWMRQALWQMLRLVRPVAHPGPDWSILEAADPELRNRTSPYGPLGRRIRSGAPVVSASPRAGTAPDVTRPPIVPGPSGESEADDTTQIIMRPWPPPKRGRGKKGKEHA